MVVEKSANTHFTVPYNIHVDTKVAYCYTSSIHRIYFMNPVNQSNPLIIRIHCLCAYM